MPILLAHCRQIFAFQSVLNFEWYSLLNDANGVKSSIDFSRFLWRSCGRAMLSPPILRGREKSSLSSWITSLPKMFGTTWPSHSSTLYRTPSVEGVVRERISCRSQKKRLQIPKVWRRGSTEVELPLAYYTLHGRGSVQGRGVAWPSRTECLRQRNNPRGKRTFFSASQNRWA